MRHPTSFADDAAFIHNFISEVSRNRETAAAAKGEGVMPIANWVHTFRDFSDITDAIAPLVLSGLAVKDASGRTILLNQILALLQGITSPSDGGLFTPFEAIRKLARDINLGTSNLIGRVTLNKDQWKRLVVIGLYAHHAAPVFESVVAGLNSDLLLEYRSETGTFHPSEAYDVLTELVDQARKFDRAQRTADWAKFMLHGESHDKNDWSVSVPILEVAGELSLFFRWADTIMLAKALALFLDGKPLIRPQPMPLTPFLDQQEGVANERTTLAQVRDFIGLE
jgi:hypothetical protein